MAHILRIATTTTPLRHHLQLHRFLSPPFSAAITTVLRRNHSRPPPRGLKLPREVQLELENSGPYSRQADEDEEEEDETTSERAKRRNRSAMKRQARVAVKLGMDLASFSTSQIKRILKAASVEKEVFEALMLVKKLGPDVREGKRRQFNYIGKLLRDAQPDLLHALIEAMKDGDQSRFQALAASAQPVDDDPEEELYESEPESEEESEDSGDHIILANKWYDGLVNKDVQISNEVYSVDNVEFDRQELRKLVRRVHHAQESSVDEDVEKSANVVTAKKSLNRFLCSLAKRFSNAQDVNL